MKIKAKVGRNNAPDHAEIIRRGRAYSNRERVMAQRLLGDIFPDFPFPRPTPSETINAILATTYLPAVRESFNSMNILGRYLEKKD